MTKFTNNKNNKNNKPILILVTVIIIITIKIMMIIIIIEGASYNDYVYDAPWGYPEYHCMIRPGQTVNQLLFKTNFWTQIYEK